MSFVVLLLVLQTSKTKASKVENFCSSFCITLRNCVVACRDEAHAHLPPVKPLDVVIGESEALLPAGTVSSILEGTIVVQVTHSFNSLGTV